MRIPHGRPIRPTSGHVHRRIRTSGGRASAVIVSAERCAQVGSDLKQLEELELAGIIKDAYRASDQTISHEEVKVHRRTTEESGE